MGRPFSHASPPCAFPQTSGFRRTGREQPKERKLGYLNSFPQNKLSGSRGKSGCPWSAASPPATRRPRSGRRWLQRPARRRGEKPALTRPGSGDRSRSHTPPRPSDPHRDLETTSANLGKQLFPGSQTPERKAAELGKRESERDADRRRRESGRAGLRGEEADPPRGDGEAQKPRSELGEERREGVGWPSLFDLGP